MVLCCLVIQKYVERENDLYQYMQTKEDLRCWCQPHCTANFSEQLAFSQTEAVSAVREALYGPQMRKLLHQVTGIELNDTMDMSAAVTRCDWFASLA